MADTTVHRQARQQAFTPDEATDRSKFSEPQLEYIDYVARQLSMWPNRNAELYGPAGAWKSERAKQ